MSDKKLVLEILQQTLLATERILRRFVPVDSVSWFLDSEEGLEKLDAICMLLIAVGESLKNVDKAAGMDLLKSYPQVDWRRAKGMRDVITHHYFDLDAEAVFDVCKENLPVLVSTLKRIISDLED